MTLNDTASVVRFFADWLAMMWFFSALVMVLSGRTMNPSHIALTAWRAIFHELKYVVPVLILIAAGCHVILGHEKDVLWAILSAASWAGFMYLHRDDDDDRWKKRRRKVADKIRVRGSRLVAEPA